MKVKELIELTLGELEVKLQDVHKEMFNLRLQQVTGNLENPARLKELRRSIARIKTIQNQKVEG